MKRDANGSVMQAMILGGPEHCLTLAVGAVSDSVEIPAKATVVRLICTVDCHVIHTPAGATDPATLSHTPLPSGYEGVFALPSTDGHRIAAVRGGGVSGELFIMWSV